MDPDPIRGEKLVIQVRDLAIRFRPPPVCHLYGMLREGATKGILVTRGVSGQTDRNSPPESH